MTTKIKCWGILWHVPAFSSALFSTHFSLFCFSPFCSLILCKWAAFTSHVLREECSTEIKKKKIQWNWEAGYLFSLSFPYSLYCSSSHLSHFQGSLLLPSPAGRESWGWHLHCAGHSLQSRTALSQTFVGKEACRFDTKRNIYVYYHL